MFSKTNVRFRRENGHKIKQLKFENFHGGKDDRFKPSKDQYVQYASQHLVAPWSCRGCTKVY